MGKRKYIWIARLDTRHWSFSTFGFSEKEVRTIMRKTWREHCKLCGVEDNWKEFEDAVSTGRFEFGCGYRDHNKVYPEWEAVPFEGWK